MTDTVKRLMDFADEMANAADRNNSSAETVARQALEAELRKLLTPLSEEQIRVALNLENLPWSSLVEDIRAVEKAHGITSHSDKSSFSGETK